MQKLLIAKLMAKISALINLRVERPVRTRKRKRQASSPQFPAQEQWQSWSKIEKVKAANRVGQTFVVVNG